jgi:hypothetical protein
MRATELYNSLQLFRLLEEKLIAFVEMKLVRLTPSVKLRANHMKCERGELP